MERDPRAYLWDAKAMRGRDRGVRANSPARQFTASVRSE